MAKGRKSYPSDVSDEEWAFCVGYLTLMTEQAPQRVYPLREIFNALRYLVKMGGAWRMMPHDLPPWPVVYQQTHRWIKAGCFETMAHDLRAILRLVLDRKADPSAVILDSRTLQSTPESGGARRLTMGHKKRKGIQGACGGRYLGASAGTHGHCRPTNRIARRWDNWRKRSKRPRAMNRAAGVCRSRLHRRTLPQRRRRKPTAFKLEVVKHTEAKRGFVLLPRRWVVERSFAWAARFRRLARDYERLAATLAGYHWLAFALLMLQSLFPKSA
jgi:transposase